MDNHINHIAFSKHRNALLIVVGLGLCATVLMLSFFIYKFWHISHGFNQVSLVTTKTHQAQQLLNQLALSQVESQVLSQLLITSNNQHLTNLYRQNVIKKQTYLNRLQQVTQDKSLGLEIRSIEKMLLRFNQSYSKRKVNRDQYHAMQVAIQQQIDSLIVDFRAQLRAKGLNDASGLVTYGYMLSVGTICLLLLWVVVLYFSRKNLKAYDRLQENLVQREFLLSNIISTIPARLFWKDKALRYQGCNNLFAQDVGLIDPALLIGKQDEDLMWQKKELTSLHATDKSIIETGVATINRERYQNRPDGSEAVVLVSKVPLRDKVGDIVGLLGVYTDITNRKKEEERFKRLQKRNKLILDASAEGIYGVDKQGITTFANPAAAEMVGWAVEDMIGKSLHEIIHHSHEDGTHYPRHECPTYAAFTEGKTQQVENDIYWRKDGSFFYVNFVSAPIWENGEVTGAVVVFNDVTERKQLLAEMRKHQEQLEDLVGERTHDLIEARDLAEEANRAKSEFLANMSHEIRTPMHGILSFASFGCKKVGAVDEAKLKTYFEKIHASASRLMCLLDGVLDLSKIEVGKMRYNKSQCQIMEAVNPAISDLEAYAADKSLTLRARGDAQDAMIYADIGRINQVVRNLISNGIKFSHTGTEIVVTVTQEKDDTNPYILMSVENKGVGIPVGELERIFDKFNQSTQTQTGAGGTGLGLAISREIVNHHGGKIWAENGKDGWTRFNVQLPKNWQEDGPRGET